METRLTLAPPQPQLVSELGNHTSVTLPPDVLAIMQLSLLSCSTTGPQSKQTCCCQSWMNWWLWTWWVADVITL